MSRPCIYFRKNVVDDRGCAGSENIDDVRATVAEYLLDVPIPLVLIPHTLITWPVPFHISWFVSPLL